MVDAEDDDDDDFASFGLPASSPAALQVLTAAADEAAAPADIASDSTMKFAGHVGLADDEDEDDFSEFGVPACPLAATFSQTGAAASSDDDDEFAEFAVPAASVTTPAFDGGSGARTLSLDSGDAEHDETQEETAVDLTDDGPGREESTDAGLGAEDATEESRVKVSKLHDSDSSMKWNECSSASPSAVGADDEREEDDDWGTFDATNAPESSGSVASASEKIPAGPSLATESDEKGTKSSPSEDAFGFGNEEDDDFNDFAAVKSGEGDNEDADDDFGGFAEAPPKDDGDDDDFGAFDSGQGGEADDFGSFDPPTTQQTLATKVDSLVSTRSSGTSEGSGKLVPALSFEGGTEGLREAAGAALSKVLSFHSPAAVSTASPATTLRQYVAEDVCSDGARAIWNSAESAHRVWKWQGSHLERQFVDALGLPLHIEASADSASRESPPLHTDTARPFDERGWSDTSRAGTSSGAQEVVAPISGDASFIVGAAQPDSNQVPVNPVDDAFGFGGFDVSANSTTQVAQTAQPPPGALLDLDALLGAGPPSASVSVNASAPPACDLLNSTMAQFGMVASVDTLQPAKPTHEPKSLDAAGWLAGLPDLSYMLQHNLSLPQAV